MIPTHCRHKTYPERGGDFPTHCAVGIEYATLPYGRPRLGEGDPCDKRGHNAGRICTSFAPWTAEEIAAEEAELNALFARVAVARSAIVAKHGKARGLQGEIACPVCETGTLRYSIAQLNGHIHAACSTAGCVRWME